MKLKDLLLEGINERNTRVAKSKIPGAGNGLFANHDFKKKSVILVAKTTKIPDNEWKLLKKSAPELLKRYGYSWDGGHLSVLGKNWPGFKLSPEAKKAISQTILRNGFHEFNFINDDQNNPNVEDYFTDHGILVVALRDIKKGEELLKEYPPDGVATYKDIPKYRDFDYLR